MLVERIRPWGVYEPGKWRKKMPNGKSEMRREKGEHVFGRGQVTNAEYNLPRGFRCAMCGEEVREKVFGRGFGKCGALQGQAEYPLCSFCLALMVEILKTGREQMVEILTKAGMTLTILDEEKRR